MKTMLALFFFIINKFFEGSLWRSFFHTIFWGRGIPTAGRKLRSILPLVVQPLKLERIFPFMGVRFISINDYYDSADYKGATGDLDVAMKNIVYDYYSKDLSVKVKTARYQKMKQGKYLGGHVPYGLMKDPKDKHKLVINPEAAAVVREIFDMAIAMMRLINMARTLNERGVETPGQYYRRKHPGTKKFAGSSNKVCWTHTNLRTILKQEMYYGAIVGHKRQVLTVGGKHTTSVPKDEQFVVEGRHEGIITKEEFRKHRKSFIR